MQNTIINLGKKIAWFFSLFEKLQVTASLNKPQQQTTDLITRSA